MTKIVANTGSTHASAAATCAVQRVKDNQYVLTVRSELPENGGELRCHYAWHYSCALATDPVSKSTIGGGYRQHESVRGYRLV